MSNTLQHLIFVAAALIFATLGHSAQPATRPAAALPAPATQPATIVSDWGHEFRGLEARLQLPSEIEQNEELAATLELRAIPNLLRPDVTRLNRYALTNHLELTLTSVATGKKFTLEPQDPNGGMFLFDDGKVFTVLDGKSTVSVPGRFMLRALAPHLVPGEYDYFVSLTVDPTSIRNAPIDRTFWEGLVTSAPLRLKVKPETFKQHVLLVPKRLSFEADGRVRFHAEDAEKIEVSLGNGLFIGAWVRGPTSMSLGGIPVPDSPNVVSRWNDQANSTVSVEVFATSTPPQHMWDPGGDGYRVLWQKTFTHPDGKK